MYGMTDGRAGGRVVREEEEVVGGGCQRSKEE